MAAGKKFAKGVTLIELLVVIAVLVVMATVVFPRFDGFLERSRMSADYNKILASVNYARSEAVKRRDDVTLTINKADADSRWVLLVEAGASGSEVTLRVDESLDAALAISPNPYSVKFTALGRSPSCSSPCIFSLTNGDTVSFKVNAAGNISQHE